MQQSRSYVFGVFRLDLSRRTLERSGEPVSLSSRGFDILRVLVEARDRVVSRAEIIGEVWPGLVVEAHNLSVQMSKLRRALGDTGDTIIATIPGRGYQFVAPLEPVAAVAPVPAVPGSPVEAAPVIPEVAPVNSKAAPVNPKAAPGIPEVAPAPPSVAWRRPVGMLLTVAMLVVAATAAGLLAHRSRPPRLSIVVMPLRDLSDKPGHRYLADAITDDLTTELARLPGSVVISRETADSYAGRAVPAGEIGRTLDVRYLLEGSLRAEEAALHLNVQLIDTGDGAHLWAERFDVSPARLDQARDQIVARIAGALDIELVRVEAARAERDRPHDPDAVDLFFRARSILDHDDTLHGFETAQALLEHAVALRPAFVDAQAMLGETLLRKVRSTDDPFEQSDMSEANAAISRALALSPDNVEALAARAHALLVDERFTDAAYSARAALAADANNVEARDVLAACALAQGRLDDAADGLQAILRLNPESALKRQRALRLGNLRLLQGRLAEAEDWLRRSIAGEPDPQAGSDDWGRAEGARLLLIAAADLGGRVDEARALYRSYARLWPHRTVWRIAALAPRYMSALPGFRRMAAALQDAGMPFHADELADDHVPARAAPLPESSFGATPLTLPGARTLDTRSLAALLRAPQPKLILDVGSGAAVVPGAIRRDPGDVADDARFVATAVRNDAGQSAGMPIVVMGDGTYGSASYNAALRLVRAGQGQVLWYRGGEEAWAAARLPAADLQR